MYRKNVDHPHELLVIEDAAVAVARLTAAGFICPVVTIQSRIAKGSFTHDAFTAWFLDFAARLAAEGAVVSGPYVCPHRFAEQCSCKKPSVLLYEQAASEHGIDLRRSFVVGDSAADMEAASRFHGRGCLVRTGWAAHDSEVQRAAPYATHVAASLTDAVTWILNGADKPRNIQ